jgi:hypothetical protein
VPARRGAGRGHVASRVGQRGQSAACRFRRGGHQDRGPEARRPAAGLADGRRQRPLEGLFAKQEERRLESQRGARKGVVPRPDRHLAGADRELPAGDDRNDRPRAGNSASAQPGLDPAAGLRMGTGRALSRPPRLWHPGRKHVRLRGAHRLCRSRAGAAADRARRTWSPGSTAPTPSWWPCGTAR